MGPLWTVGLQALQTRLDTPAIPWKALVNALLWGVYVFETYVSWRQYRMYRRTCLLYTSDAADEILTV